MSDLSYVHVAGVVQAELQLEKLQFKSCPLGRDGRPLKAGQDPLVMQT